jgi:hypothetical protein
LRTSKASFNYFVVDVWKQSTSWATELPGSSLPSAGRSLSSPPTSRPTRLQLETTWACALYPFQQAIHQLTALSSLQLTILFPKYINIRRGQYICAIVGLTSTPWNIQNSAKTFTFFLSGYSIFLAPVAAIMIAD